MPATVKIRVEGRNQKYKPILLVVLFRCLRAGLTETDFCKSVGVSKQSLDNWKKKYKDVREAIAMARKELASEETFPEWVYARLAPELQELWNKIREWEEEENGVAKIELMLAENGVRVRQQLFLHALCAGSFSYSEALKKVNVSKREFDRWVNSDPGFALLVEEMQWHKGNFFEEKLVQLAKEGNQAAVIFGNKTLNASRGYKTETDVNVKVSGTVGVLDLSLLLPYLRPETRLELLEAVRRQEDDAAKLTVQPILTPEARLVQQITDLGEEV